MEKIGLGQLHLLSQGDVKESESCLSEALLTADLCVFSHLSCRADYVCALVVKGACLRAGWCIWMCMCKWGTLKDLSLSLCCVNEQSVLLIFSQAYPVVALALPVVTGKPWQFKSVDIVLAVGSTYGEDKSVCFWWSATIRVAESLIDANQGAELKSRRKQCCRSELHFYYRHRIKDNLTLFFIKKKILLHVFEMTQNNGFTSKSHFHFLVKS